MRRVDFSLLTSRFSLLFLFGLAGCATNQAKDGGSRPLFSQASSGAELWTIRCAHSDSPDHARDMGSLAEMLKRVQGLQAKNVRLDTTPTGSTIYYGQYTKVASAKTGRLVFPAQYQQDIELIRRLSVNQRTPFFYAEPEQISKPNAGGLGEWDVSMAKGVYTLQIAVFYNTPNFSQREVAANEYVRLLREGGYSAYYRHEQVRSYVFVGDFNETDIIFAGGTPQLGPKVEQFIARNEAEFRHISENGQIIKQQMPNGQFAPPLSYLVPVPHEPSKQPPR
jgi:hypothetical protein